MAREDRKYSKEHEWVQVSGETATIGITDFATDSLGDVVFVDLPALGSKVKQFAKFGEVESVKAVSDLFAPISGEVVERNESAVDSPEKVNQSPYDDGWLIKVKVTHPSELDALLDAAQYQQHTAESGT